MANVFANEMPTIIRTLIFNRQNTVVSQLGNFLTRKDVKVYADFLKDIFAKIYILDTIPSHMRDYCRLSDTLLPDGSNVAGVIAAFPDVERKSIEAALTKYVGQLPDNPFKKIYVELVGKFGQDAMLYGTEIMPGGEEIDIDARTMSDGTLRAIALLTAILTREKGSLLVIEEVDNGLHPSKAGILLKSMIELGKEQGVDILITTHNPALMDALEKDLLPFISVVDRDETTGYSVIGLLEDFEKLPKYLAQGSLGKIMTEGLINDVETPAP
jgi:predicted ATPase